MKQPPSITLSEPFPLLDEGHYIAVCTDAAFAWARQWKKWIARLVLEPQNYEGRPYTGRLCKFLGLGKDPERPCAGPQSDFRKLFVEANGAQPVSTEAGMDVFVGLRYEIDVETVKKDRRERQRRPEHWYSIVREIHLAGNWPEYLSTWQPSNPEPSNTPTPVTPEDPSTDQQSNTANTPQAVACGSSVSVLLRNEWIRK